MAVCEISKIGHPILKQVAEHVAGPTVSEIADIAGDMQNIRLCAGSCDEVIESSGESWPA
jgi:peptide deformylase